MLNTVPNEFQQKVGKLIVRNSNVLDILTKCQSSCAKVCRSTVKCATGCGCIKIAGEKSVFSQDESTEHFPREMSKIKGKICAECSARAENEIGEMLFYIASLCNALGLSMSDIMNREIKNVEMLGKYSLR